MTIGTTNQAEISFIKETTAGTTPTSPAMQLLRYTGENLKYENQTAQSDEIREDRGVSDLVVVDQRNGGSIDGELSGTTFDSFFEAALRANATFSTDTMTETTIAATGTGFTDSGSGFVSNGFDVGQTVKISGFSDSSIDGYYRITSLAAGTIDTYPAPPATEAASASVTIEGSTIIAGTTDHSYTIQKAMQDIDTPAYINFRGVRVAGFNLAMSSGAKTTCSFDFLGLNSEVTTTQISGRTESAKTTTDIMTSVVTGNDITAIGTNVSTAVKFTNFNIQYNNNLRELKAIGTLGAIDIRAGLIDAKANINPYFEDIQLLNAFLNNQEFALTAHCVGDDGHRLVFSMPKVKFVTQDLAAGAANQDLMINAQVQALIDANNVSFRIDKFTS